MPSRTLAKSRSREKTVLKYSSWTFCTGKLPKTPSTASEHSSEKYRTKVKHTTLSMKRNQKTTESKCSSKCYRREMLPKLPLKSLSIRTFIEMLVKKYSSKKHAQNATKISLSKKKGVLKLSSWNFCSEKLPKTPSTVSKHYSEKYRTKVSLKTPTKKRNQKLTEVKCSSKCYYREMLPKKPL